MVTVQSKTITQKEYDKIYTNLLQSGGYYREIVRDSQGIRVAELIIKDTITYLIAEDKIVITSDSVVYVNNLER